MMAGVTVTIPGIAAIDEAKQALMAQAVAEQFNIVTANPPASTDPNDQLRRPSVGDLGRPLQTVRLA